MSAGRNFIVSKQKYFSRVSFSTCTERHTKGHMHTYFLHLPGYNASEQKFKNTRCSYYMEAKHLHTLVYTQALKNNVLSAVGWICLSPLSDHQDALFHFTWKIKHQKIVSKVSWTCKGLIPAQHQYFIIVTGMISAGWWSFELTVNSNLKAYRWSFEDAGYSYRSPVSWSVSALQRGRLKACRFSAGLQNKGHLTLDTVRTLVQLSFVISLLHPPCSCCRFSDSCPIPPHHLTSALTSM